MIHHLNLLLRKFFEAQLQLKAEQIGFEPPDDAWRNYVATIIKKPALNIYLVDIRENTGRRSNEQVRQSQNGTVVETPAPRWMDCHYLITAWDPATANLAQGVEPTLPEHLLLYGVTGILMKAHSLVPQQVYAPDPLPTDFPPGMGDVELPIIVLPPEGFPKLPEFWGTMGTGNRWKPAVYLVVTLPVIIDQTIISTMVTTLVSKYGLMPQDTPEILITIGGDVLDTKHPLPDGKAAPVVGAVVELETNAAELLQTIATDEEGRYTFTGLQEGQYRLLVRAQGHTDTTVPVDVRAEPHGTGIILYDVRF